MVDSQTSLLNFALPGRRRHIPAAPEPEATSMGRIDKWTKPA